MSLSRNPEHPRAAYYTATPFDDVDNLLNGVKRFNGLSEYSKSEHKELVIRPLNFMLKHQSYFEEKPFMAN